MPSEAFNYARAKDAILAFIAGGGFPSIGTAEGDLALLGAGGKFDAALLPEITGGITQQSIDDAIAALVDSSPGTLDTLNELAAALGDDPNFAASIAAQIAGKQPLDADLTAIAALATTSYGRALLTLADAAALTAALNAFTSAAKGLVPASGGGTANFLRADGTFAAPAGASTLPAPEQWAVGVADGGGQGADYWYNYTAATRTVTIFYARESSGSSGNFGIQKSLAAAPRNFNNTVLASTFVGPSDSGTVSAVTVEAGCGLKFSDGGRGTFGIVTCTA